MLANGEERDSPYVKVLLEWDDGERVTEVLVSESGNPLLGVELLSGNLLQIEMTDGGEVLIDAL